MIDRRRLRVLLVAIATAAAAPTVGVAVWTQLPLPGNVADPAPPTSVTILDRHGLPLRTTRDADGARGGWVPLDDMDPELVQAFLAVEDHRFFEHRGVDAMAVARAARDNLVSGRIVSGASTITMQAARILRPSPRTLAGKAVQALWALRIERQRDKDWILEQYLNRVPLGQGAIGVGAAARLYFGTGPGDLSLGQAALLAGLARTPARDNPLVDPERARPRRTLVLARMAELGFAIPADVPRAEREPVLSRTRGTPFLAPHFTTWALTGLDDPSGTVTTTLDLDLQRALEAEVRHTVANLEDQGARHAAVVVLENGTGDILAWVGSPDFWADTAGQVDMVVSRRQPGSTLKPFLYGLAFERGYTAATVLPDIPRTYATPTGPYTPRNYDRRFRGPVRTRVALASSLNVPAVELAHRIGTSSFLSLLRDAGFDSLDREPTHYGLGLALGNGEVTLLELANAYRGLAAGGVLRPVRWQAEVPSARVARRFLQPGPATLVLDILSDPIARAPGFGTSSPLDFPFPAAAKTGTSRHFTDNWAVATTGGFTVAVWVGDFLGRPMRAVSGVTGAGPLLHRSVLETARRYPAGHLPGPEMAGAEAVPVCALSGLRPANGCATVIEWFLPGAAPERRDDWESGGRLTLPAGYADWAATHLAAASQGSGDASRDPESGRPERPEPGIGEARIVSPLDGDVYEVPVGTDPRYSTLPLVATGEGVRWSVDGEGVQGRRWRLVAGTHRIGASWPSGEADSVTIKVVRR